MPKEGLAVELLGDASALRRAGRAAGLPETCTLHGLRYTTATILRELGVDPLDIAEILGHRTEAMTRKHSEKRRRAARAIVKLDAAELAAERPAGTAGETAGDAPRET